jgi:ERF superfamily protein
MSQADPTKTNQPHQRPTAGVAGTSTAGSATDNSGERLRGKRHRAAHVIRVDARRPAAEPPQPTLPIAPKPRTSLSSRFDAPPLTLKQKFAEVRRRISYIQKRGRNERFNYSYVTAADLAGAVGDALAELEVVVIPQLASISHETISPNQGYAERLTRVVMTYTFMDVNSAEQLTVKVPGEGRDPGDKGPYKAMTGALKYALLQSFLIATGDDPEDERADDVRYGGSNSNGAAVPAPVVISREQLGELKELIDQTGTDVAKMLEYFKISKIEEMTTVMYGRAIQALKRKRGTAATRGEAHA